MKTVAIYHKSVPNNKNQEKVDLLKNYAIGVSKTGDKVIDVNSHNYQLTDVGVIQGWLGEGTVTTPHLKLRNDVITNQLKNKKYVLAVDSNLFLYATPGNPLHYLRYSFNGVFPNTGIYCDTEIDPNRWQSISENLNIPLKDYRTNGSHILLCLQRNGGWSMGNFDVQDWAINTITELRKYTDRKIVLRGHPGDKAAKEYLDPANSKCRIKDFKNIEFSKFEKTLLEDLKGAWAVVNHNSSPTVGAAIEGYPIFVTDPTRSQCKDIANLNISQIENPVMPDRQRWVERLSMFHWNFEELKSGECWQHMKNYAK